METGVGDVVDTSRQALKPSHDADSPQPPTSTITLGDTDAGKMHSGVGTGVGTLDDQNPTMNNFVIVHLMLIQYKIKIKKTFNKEEVTFRHLHVDFYFHCGWVVAMGRACWQPKCRRSECPQDNSSQSSPECPSDQGGQPGWPHSARASAGRAPTGHCTLQKGCLGEFSREPVGVCDTWGAAVTTCHDLWASPLSSADEVTSSSGSIRRVSGGVRWPPESRSCGGGFFTSGLAWRSGRAPKQEVPVLAGRP